jgi:hypothetical protein
MAFTSSREYIGVEATTGSAGHTILGVPPARNGGTWFAIANGIMARKTGELPAKAGTRSLSKKLANSRYGYEQHPGTSKTPGAFGKETERMRAHESASGSTREGKTNTLGKMRRG